MARNFNRQKDELLIEAVKRHNAIFDANHKHYKNNLMKHKSWESISSTIGIPVEDCKRRWKSLRDQFNKKRKADVTGNGSGRLSGNWEYMTLMSFIPRGTLEECETMVKRCPENYENSPECDFAQKLKNSNGPSFKKQKLSFNDEYSDEVEKKEDEDVLASYEHLLLKAKSSANKTPLHKFFESMADAVESLPPQVQAEVKLRVCQVVTEAELKVYALQNSPC